MGLPPLAHAPQRLGRLRPGTTARITLVEVEGDVGQRLLSFGLTVGAEVTVVREAPLRDPLQVACGGVSFALRRHDADLVWVTLADPPPATAAGEAAR